jgi:hypothetical protein
MSKFILILMGLVTFIRIPLFNLFLVGDWVPPFLEFSNKDLKGIILSGLRISGVSLRVINLELWSKEIFFLG